MYIIYVYKILSTYIIPLHNKTAMTKQRAPYAAALLFKVSRKVDRSASDISIIRVLVLKLFHCNTRINR